MAMAQYPTFDLTDPWNLESRYTQAEIDKMTEEELDDARNRLWTNYCVSSTFEPGSTAKPFTVAAGLETGVLKGNETFVCDGGETIAGSRVRCVNRSGHGVETLRKSLMDSCNDALMQISYRLGDDDFCKYQNLFGFGLRTNVDLPGEARTDSLIYHAENMKTVDLATNSFGQNFNVTMIQMGGAFCSLINGGKYYQPHIVSKVLDENGNVLRTVNPVLIKQTVSEETSKQVCSYMYDTVSDGTGRYAKVAGYSMGGKTGTAQKSVGGSKDEKNYLVSFIGYLPANDPELMIYVVVDEPNAKEQSHSQYAQNLTREILEEALPYLNIYPDEIAPESALTPEETGFRTGLDGVIVPSASGTLIEEDDETQEAAASKKEDTSADNAETGSAADKKEDAAGDADSEAPVEQDAKEDEKQDADAASNENSKENSEEDTKEDANEASHESDDEETNEPSETEGAPSDE